MEIPTPPSQPNLQKPGVAKGASIMQEVSSKYNKEKLSTRFKVITATAIAILIILNLILFLLWRNSQAIISPIPTLP
jgi:hypothetical protein